MKPASISEIKQELNNLAPSKLFDLCLRLAKYKKDNKELLNYLLFEAHDEQEYISSVKKQIEKDFEGINQSNLYFVKKSLRKILRNVARHVRYTSSKQAEVELLIHFCHTLKNAGVPLKNSIVLNNLYQFQLKKVAKIIATLHEDLQYDYIKEVESLSL